MTEPASPLNFGPDWLTQLAGKSKPTRTAGSAGAGGSSSSHPAGPRQVPRSNHHADESTSEWGQPRSRGPALRAAGPPHGGPTFAAAANTAPPSSAGGAGGGGMGGLNLASSGGVESRLKYSKEQMLEFYRPKAMPSNLHRLPLIARSELTPPMACVPLSEQEKRDLAEKSINSTVSHAVSPRAGTGRGRPPWQERAAEPGVTRTSRQTSWGEPESPRHIDRDRNETRWIERRRRPSVEEPAPLSPQRSNSFDKYDKAAAKSRATFGERRSQRSTEDLNWRAPKPAEPPAAAGATTTTTATASSALDSWTRQGPPSRQSSNASRDVPAWSDAKIESSLLGGFDPSGNFVAEGDSALLGGLEDEPATDQGTRISSSVGEDVLRDLTEDFDKKLDTNGAPASSAPPSAGVRPGSDWPSSEPNTPSSPVTPASPATFPEPAAVPSPSSTNWFYQDPTGNEQGPFTASEMTEWFEHGYFQPSLLIRRDFDQQLVPLSNLLELSAKHAAHPFAIVLPSTWPAVPSNTIPASPLASQQAPPAGGLGLGQQSAVPAPVSPAAGGAGTPNAAVWGSAELRGQHPQQQPYQPQQQAYLHHQSQPDQAAMHPMQMLQFLQQQQHEHMLQQQQPQAQPQPSPQPQQHGHPQGPLHPHEHMMRVMQQQQQQQQHPEQPQKPQPQQQPQQQPLQQPLQPHAPQHLAQQQVVLQEDIKRLEEYLNGVRQQYAVAYSRGFGQDPQQPPLQVVEQQIMMHIHQRRQQLIQLSTLHQQHMAAQHGAPRPGGPMVPQHQIPQQPPVHQQPQQHPPAARQQSTQPGADTSPLLSQSSSEPSAWGAATTTPGSSAAPTTAAWGAAAPAAGNSAWPAPEPALATPAEFGEKADPAHSQQQEPAQQQQQQQKPREEQQPDAAAPAAAPTSTAVPSSAAAPSSAPAPAPTSTTAPATEAQVSGSKANRKKKRQQKQAELQRQQQAKQQEQQQPQQAKQPAPRAQVASVPTPKLSFLEIQAEAERVQQHEQRERERELETQRAMSLSQQAAQAQAAAAWNASNTQQWTEPVVPQQSNSKKSFLEIQKEEEAQRKRHAARAPQPTPTSQKQALTSPWGTQNQQITAPPPATAPASTPVWGSSGAQTAAAPPATPPAAAQQGIWDYDDTPNKAAQPGSFSRQQQQQVTKANKQAGSKGAKGSKSLQVTSQPAPDQAFMKWCEGQLQGSAAIDVPTFVTFLQEIGNASEIEEYVVDVLGSSERSRTFARQFAERRGLKVPSKGGSPWGTQQQPSSSEWQTVSSGKQRSGAVAGSPQQAQAQPSAGGRGQGKRKKKGKFAPVDPSKMLGFSVTAATNMNRGEIERPA